jgi:hypothetical protein
MGKRGRKSAAEMVIDQAPAIIQRPEPPYELWRDDEQQVWSRVVSDLPADWFSGRNIDLLVEYCTHVVSCRRLAQLIQAEEQGDGDLDVRQWSALMRAHAAQSARVQSLATSMRITQQSTYTAQAGATALKNTAKGKRPWET